VSRGEKQAERYIFLDDKNVDTRQFEIRDKIAEEYYLYQFYSKNREYVLLTKDDFEDGDYVIEGTVINCPDANSIGENFKIATELPILLSVEAKSKIVPIANKEEFASYLNQQAFDYSGFEEFVFYHSEKKSIFRFPRIVENLILIFLVSGKEDGYPLHLLIWGPPHMGKSALLECIKEKFDEYQEIVDSGGSTLKALIPSFKGSLVAPGALVRARKICLIDEFIRTGSDTENRDDMLGALNTLLEHKRREFGSGNCKSNFRMSARCLFVTNPTHSYETVHKLFHNINSPFLSRLYLFPIYGDTLKEIRVKIETEDVTHVLNSTMTKDQFMTIIEYLQSIQSTFDREKVKQIYAQYKQIIPHEFLDVFSRYIHHCYCLMDGIVKLRCLKEGLLEFEAIPEDYDLLDNILRQTVNGWLDFDS
jgi:hypothetical protein